MGTKSIQVSEAFHSYVEAHKKEDETLGETLVRLTGGPRPEIVAGLVSEETADYYGFSTDEIRFIQTAARGQDSDYSECLLATSVHGRRRLEIRSGPFEHTVLDDALDPWDWLAGVEGIDLVEGDGTTRETAFHEDLELTDLPHVMNRDMDLQMAMEADHEDVHAADLNDVVDADPENDPDRGSGAVTNGQTTEEP